MTTRRDAVVATSILVFFVIGEAAVLYFVDLAALRLVLGILVLAPIILVGARVAVLDYLRSIVAREPMPRRFLRMRRLIDRALDEMRRMNHIAADGRRGVRPAEETAEMLDQIESDLTGLIRDLRRVAGEEAPPEEIEWSPPSDDARSAPALT